MTDITPAKIPVHPLLSKREAEFVTAQQTPILTSMEVEEAIKKLIIIINRAYIELEKSPAGLNPLERRRSLDVFSKLILNDLKLYFPFVTIGELEVAVRRGIRREYGEYYTFSVVTVHQFVDGYFKSEARLAVLKKQERFLMMKEIADEIPPDEATIWTWIEDNIRYCHETFRKTKRIIDLGNCIYDHLVNTGFINLTLEEKLEIFEQASAEVSREAKFQESISYHSWKLSQKDTGNGWQAKCRSKEIAVKRFFQTNPDLEEVIEKVRELHFSQKNLPKKS